MKDLLKFALIVAAMFYFLSLGAIAMIAALIVLVIVHEFGHWIVARLCGFDVPTFSVGMGSSPRLLLGKFWGTEFQITPWLFGGYVAINPADEQFAAAAAWKRASVLVAGVVMNVIAAFAIIFGLLAFVGVGHGELQNLSVAELDQSLTIARDAGFQPGDKILSVNGQAIRHFDEFRGQLANHKGVPVTIGVERNGEALDIAVTPNADGRIGFRPAGNPVVVYERIGVLEAGQKSGEMVVNGFFGMGKGLLMMLHVLPPPENLPDGATDVHGVVAIVQIGASAFSGGLYSFLMIVAMISLNLAFLNILPIPVLDGGHLMFIALEKVGIRPSKETQGRISFIFMMLLLALMLFGLFNDIVNPIQFK